jgi:hypothetical protein
MKRVAIFSFLLISLTFSCTNSSSRLNVDLSDVPEPSIQIERYGQDLFHINTDNLATELPLLAEKYPFFLGEPPLDTLAFIQIHDWITDPFLRELASATESAFPDLNKIEEDLNLAFRHYLYYYPQSSIPKIYTYISGLDFEYPVQLQNNIMLISLDMYLGKDFEPYAMSRIPQYRSRRATPEHIARDAMIEMANQIPISYESENVLLDQMIEKGKVMYFIDAMIPEAHDTIKIGYSNAQLEWCWANENNLWAFIIENDLLFSSDYEKTHKLIIDGPFTSFFPEGSPARTGWWIGWQIVRHFMDNNPDVNLPQLMEDLTPRQVLDNSGYNP